MTSHDSVKIGFTQKAISCMPHVSSCIFAAELPNHIGIYSIMRKVIMISGVNQITGWCSSGQN